MGSIYLHQWFMEKHEGADGQSFFVACGNVTGHPSIMDTTFINTSPMVGYEILESSEEIVIHTKNSNYYCKMVDCDFEILETYEAISEWAQLADKYKDHRINYDVPDQSALIVYSDHREYFFEYAAVNMNGELIPLSMVVQEGSTQESVIICGDGTKIEGYIDIGYFPHYRHMEYYSCYVGGMDVYIENVGENTVYSTFDIGVIKLEPGDRKLVCKDSIEPRDSLPELHKGALYPQA